MTRGLTLLLLGFLWIASRTATADTASSSGCRITVIAEFPVTMRGHQILTTGSINDQPIKVLIDTGASVSMVWRPSAVRLGLKLRDAGGSVVGVGGRSQLQTAYLEALRIDRYVGRNRSFLVGGDRPAPYDLILGEDFLSNFNVEFDLGHKAVRLLTLDHCVPEQLAYWSERYELADLVATPKAAVRVMPRVRLNERGVDAILDSGASNSVVSRGLAITLGAVLLERSGGVSQGVGKGTLETEIGTFDSVAVGDESVQHAKLLLADLNKNNVWSTTGSRIEAVHAMVPDMLLGADFLLSHRVVVPSELRKMTFTYEGGPVFVTIRPRPVDPPPEGQGAGSDDPTPTMPKSPE
jgi:predicted aspartyl protease